MAREKCAENESHLLRFQLSEFQNAIPFQALVPAFQEEAKQYPSMNYFGNVEAEFEKVGLGVN